MRLSFRYSFVLFALLFCAIGQILTYAHPLPHPLYAPSTTLNPHPLITNYRPPVPSSSSIPSQNNMPLGALPLLNAPISPSRPGRASLVDQQLSPPPSVPELSRLSVQGVPVSNKEQISPQKSAEDKTRLSIFSVIHPALHAAFAAERASDRPAPPLEPLTKVEYHSSPLRGTEARDRAAIGLLPSAQQERQARNNDHQALETTPTTPTQRDVSTLKAPSSYEYAGMPPPLRQPGDIQQKNLPKPANSSVQDHEGYSSTANFPTTLLSYPQDAVPHGRDMPEVPAVPIPAALVSQDGYVLPGSTATTAQTIPLVPTIAPETPRIQQAALDSLESVWNRLVSTAKRTLETIMTSQESAASSSDIAANPAMHQNLPRGAAPTPSADYSKKDVTEIVNDIMHQIQSHQEDMQAHQEMLKNTGRWDPDHLTKRERQHGVKAPMLVMRKSMPLSPEVLADAVTKSATKLIRAKPSPMPWAVASRLLTDVHSQLADILQQASAISEKGTPSQNNARGLPRVERLAGTQTDVTQTGRAVTKSLQRGNGVQQMGKNSAPRAEPRMATEWQQRQAQSQQIAWQGSPSMGRSL